MTLSKHHDKQTNRLFRVFRWLLAVLVFLLLAFSLIVVHFSLKGGYGSQEEVMVEIPEGSSLSDVADILYEKGIVFDKTLFKLYLRKQEGGPVRAGKYQMTQSSGFSSAVGQLKEGYRGSFNSLTIPEGSDIKKVAELIGQASGQDSDEVLDQLSDPALFDQLYSKYPELLAQVKDNDQVRYKLEGYLFPATYSFDPEKTSLADLVSQMVGRMDQVRLAEEAKGGGTGLNFHQIITMASLIEKEASTPEDRRLVAGVFYNRLRENMPLQSDISVNYSNDQHASYVTIDDTLKDSPYNLYQNRGLGPGPFNCPGQDSIDAALHPTTSDYLYFVADLKTGKVYYSENYEDHMEKVDQYVSEEDAKLAQKPDDSQEETGNSEAGEPEGQD